MPKLGDVAHQQIRVFELPSPSGAVYLLQPPLPFGTHLDHDRPAHYCALGARLGQWPLGLAVSNGIGHLISLFRHDPWTYIGALGVHRTNHSSGYDDPRCRPEAGRYANYETPPLQLTQKRSVRIEAGAPRLP